MKVLFYSPYIPGQFGGGEKHLFDVATLVAQKHQVYIAIANEYLENKEAVVYFNQLRDKYEKFLNYSLSKLKFVASQLQSGSVLTKLKETKNYDYLYYVTDGSFFLSAAKKNNLHIQIPFTNSLSLADKLKLTTWQLKNTNSDFTKQIIQKYWQIKVDYVHHPLVSLDEIKPGKQKEKIILNVGRFFRQLHSKRQDVLVKFFKTLLDEAKTELKGWRLVLLGNVEDDSYLNEVINLAKGYPIEIKTKVSRQELIKLYQKASIYWHATGYQVDEELNPAKVEHFGITTIEAMAAGCVPVVIGKGGQQEILTGKLSDLLWQTKQECLTLTKELIANNNKYLEYQELSLKQVKKFSKQKFEKVVWEMFR